MLAHKCCCGDCNYFSDFASGSSRPGPLGTNYTVLSGTWDVASDRLRCTGNGELRIDKLSPLVTGRRRMSVGIDSYNAATDRVRLGIDYDGPDDYHWAEGPVLASGAGPWGVGRRVGGAETTLTLLNDVQRWGQLSGFGFYTGNASLCLNNTNLWAGSLYSFPSSNYNVGFTPAPIGGRKAIIKVETAGQVVFRDLLLDACATGCSPCAFCNETPEFLDWAISAFTIRSSQGGATIEAYWPAPGVAGLTGTFDLRYGNTGFGGGSACSYSTGYLPLAAPVTIPWPDTLAWPGGGLALGGITFTKFAWNVSLNSSGCSASLVVRCDPPASFTDTLATFTGPAFSCGSGDIAFTQDFVAGSATLTVP